MTDPLNLNGTGVRGKNLSQRKYATKSAAYF
jgi:hypothetical protein